MDERRLGLLVTSFAEVRAVQGTAAALFYQRLFAHDPTLRRLFAHVDMTAEERKLMGAIGFVVGSLRKLDLLIPVLESLSAKHIGNGVKPHHYDIVGKALIEALSLRFGKRFTGEVRSAWTQTYQMIARAMKRAAYGEAEAINA